MIAPATSAAGSLAATLMTEKAAEIFTRPCPGVMPAAMGDADVLPSSPGSTNTIAGPSSDSKRRPPVARVHTEQLVTAAGESPRRFLELACTAAISSSRAMEEAPRGFLGVVCGRKRGVVERVPSARVLFESLLLERVRSDRVLLERKPPRDFARGYAWVCAG